MSKAKRELTIDELNELRLKHIQKMKDNGEGNFKNPICRECIRKYKDEKDYHLIDCTGIPLEPEDYIPKSLRDTMSPEDKAKMILAQDKVKWLKANFDWEAYPYQERTLHCSSNRMVLRYGRRSGKCLAKESALMTTRGPVNIEDVYKGQNYILLTLNQKTQKIERAKSYHIWENGVKPVYRLKTKTGKTNFATENHPYLTLGNDGLFKWVELKDLKIGDFIAVVNYHTETQNDILWDRVTIIEYEKDELTYDLTVDGTHTLISDDIISHNSESMAAEILYSAFAQPGGPVTEGGHKKPVYRIMVISPFEDQVINIFDKILEILMRNEEFYKEISRFVKTPSYRMAFSNGTIILGKSAGTKSGQGAASSRGQGVELLIMDECVQEGSIVNTSKYAIKPVEQLKLSDGILGGNRKQLMEGDITALSKRESDLILLMNPITNLTCTPKHPIFNGRKDVFAKDATEVVTSIFTQELNFRRDAIVARLLGYNYGDGWLCNTAKTKSVGFSGQVSDLEQVVEDITLLGYKRQTISTRVTENKVRGIKGVTSQIVCDDMFNEFKELCPNSLKVFQPLRVPKYIMKHGRNYLKANFLSGLFSAESTGISYQKNNRTPRGLDLRMLSTKKEWLLQWFADLQTLLSDLGVASSIQKIVYKEVEGRYDGVLSVNSAKSNIDKFIEQVGFCYNPKKTKSCNIWKLYRWFEHNYNKDVWKKQRSILGETGSAKVVGLKLGIPKSTVKYHRKYINELMSGPFLKPLELYNKLLVFENHIKLPITNRRFLASKGIVYNLTSTAYHRFFANGMLTHNCAYMGEDDFTAILPMLQEHAHTRFIASSTPSGFRNRFYNMCHNPYFKEFHVPITSKPNWSKQMEREARETCSTELEWQLEYMAEWARAEGGVFPADLVETALTNYTYVSDKFQYEDVIKRYTYDPTWTYCIGVDNNEKAGAWAVVLGKNPTDDKFYAVDRRGIEKADFKQIAGMELVRELNFSWKPEFIYMDKKPSSTAFELLKKFGQQNLGTENRMDARLAHIVKQFDFGANIERPNQAGGQKKERLKPFMMGLLVRKFEGGEIVLSKYDKLMYQQIIDYEVNLTPAGNVTYKSGPKGDHCLDALLLATLAHALEYSAYGYSPMPMQAAFAPGFGVGPQDIFEQTEEKSKRILDIPKTKRTVPENVLSFIPLQGGRKRNVKHQIIKRRRF